MHWIHMIHLVHGIHAATPTIWRHSSLWDVAMFRHAVAPVHGHASAWAHVHLLVGIVHTHVLLPHTAALVPTIAIMFPKLKKNKKNK